MHKDYYIYHDTDADAIEEQFPEEYRETVSWADLYSYITDMTDEQLQKPVLILTKYSGKVRAILDVVPYINIESSALLTDIQKENSEYANNDQQFIVV